MSDAVTPIRRKHGGTCIPFTLFLQSLSPEHTSLSENIDNTQRSREVCFQGPSTMAHSP